MPATISTPVSSTSSRPRFRGVLCASLLFGGVATATPQETSNEPVVGESWVQVVPGTATELVMKPVPGPEDEPLWVMEKELSWNLFDIFIFRLDEKKGNSSPASDAVTRPTKPYIAVDRGFGHNGYPAISMSLKGAIQFAEWVSAKTGRTYRVPTVEQWSRICSAAEIPSSQLDEYAWYRANSEETTHPIGSRKADALGLHDLYGNVAEWCIAGGTAQKPVGVLMGGGYESPAGELNCTDTVAYDPMWNDSDPQFPKSIWWLADAAFVGLRLVCVEDEVDDQAIPAAETSEKTAAISQEHANDES